MGLLFSNGLKEKTRVKFKVKELGVEWLKKP